MRLTTILCQLTGTFAGFLSTVRYLPAVALVSYLFDRSHSWYAAFQKIFVLVQGTFTPQVIRHDRRTKALDAEPPIVSFAKSTLIGGGPVNATVRHTENTHE